MSCGKGVRASDQTPRASTVAETEGEHAEDGEHGEHRAEREGGERRAARRSERERDQEVSAGARATRASVELTAFRLGAALWRGYRKS